MMEDRFLENDPVPYFLAGPIEEAEQSRVKQVISSDLFRKAVLGVSGAATVLAVVWVVHSIMFASVTASEVTRSASVPAAKVQQPADVSSRDGGGQSAPAPQPATVAQAAPVVPQAAPAPLAMPAPQAAPAAQAAPAEAAPATAQGDDLLAAFKAAVENKAAVETKGTVETKAEPDQPQTDALLNQFKAWAVEDNVQAPARQPEPPQMARTDAVVQAARAEIVPTARTDVVPLPKRRPTHVDHAGRTHDAPLLQQQNQPSLLRQFGWRN
jgi:hypothetical protein